jgi:hypothetical protein
MLVEIDSRVHVRIATGRLALVPDPDLFVVVVVVVVGLVVFIAIVDSIPVVVVLYQR